MRTVFAAIGTMCLTALLVAVGQSLIFEAWSSSLPTLPRAVDPILFDELVLYALFPAVVIAGTAVATLLTGNRPFVVSLLGATPVFLGVVLLRRYDVVSMLLLLAGFTLLCLSTVKLTNQLVAGRRAR